LERATGYAARNIDAQNNLLPGGTPMGTDTLSRVYSVTKTFTAALTLKLANASAFSLNDPIIKYLPALAAVNPAVNLNVTIQQLLAHESGYSDYTQEINLQIAIIVIMCAGLFSTIHSLQQRKQPCSKC
jgi:D-alanyl-D-alanine carboxypeptidase